MTFVDLVLYLFVVFVVYCIHWYVTLPKNLPPGPKGIPFFGNMLQTIGKEPHLLLESWTKKYGPVVSFYMGKTLVILLGNLESIDEALVKQGEVFSGRPESGLTPTQLESKSGIIAADGPNWKEQRRFALSTLRDFGFGRPILQSKITEEAEYLLSDIESKNGRPFDIQTLLNKSVSNVICAMVFGHRFDDEEFLITLNRLNYRISQSKFTILSPLVYFPWFRYLPIVKQKFEKMFNETDDHFVYLDKVIQETVKTFDPVDTPTNYIHAFLKAREDQMGTTFNNKTLLASVNNLFAAGSETTSTTLRWGIYFLAKNMHIQEELYKELEEAVGANNVPSWEDRNRLPFTEACIMEIQRLANLVPLSLTHRTMDDTKLMGYDVPKDAWVIPLLWNVLTNPVYFLNPDKFDPRRFLDANNKIRKDNAFIPFSAGKRICLGESLAKMELFIFFTSMITKFKFTFPAGQPEPPLKRICGITMTPANFDICATRRHE